MDFERIKLADLPMVYVVAELHLGGRRYLAAASEARGGRALIMDPETRETADLWLGDTGCMNIVQIPGQERLLAITRFYPVFDSKNAAVCLLEPTEQGYMHPWRMREVAHVPFCHRIGVVESSKGLFLLACQVCGDKAYTEDWSVPGALLTARIPEAGDESEWRLTRAYDGLFRNHGLNIEKGSQISISADNGVLRFDMADYSEGDAMIPSHIRKTPTSDISRWEDESGTLEAAIEPFHGNRGAAYAMEGWETKPLASWEIEFGHVVWIGRLCGRRAVILGSRAGREKALEIVPLDTGERLTLEVGAGPTQITVYEEGDDTCILSANHEPGEVLLYKLHSL